LFSIVALNLD